MSDNTENNVSDNKELDANNAPVNVEQAKVLPQEQVTPPAQAPVTAEVIVQPDEATQDVLDEIAEIQAAIEANEGPLDDVATAAGSNSDGGRSSAVEFSRDGAETIATSSFTTEAFELDNETDGREFREITNNNLAASTTVNDDIDLNVSVTNTLTEDSVDSTTVIATATASDEDGGDITYSLSDSDAANFIIDSDTGNVTLTDAGVALVNGGGRLTRVYGNGGIDHG